MGCWQFGCYTQGPFPSKRYHQVRKDGRHIDIHTLFQSRSPMYMVPALDKKSDETMEAAVLALRVCVCVRERERKRERACVHGCVWVCVSVDVCVCVSHVLSGEEEGGAQRDERRDEAPGAGLDEGAQRGLARQFEGGRQRVHLELDAVCGVVVVVESACGVERGYLRGGPIKTPTHTHPPTLPNPPYDNNTHPPTHPPSHEQNNPLLPSTPTGTDLRFCASSPSISLSIRRFSSARAWICSSSSCTCRVMA